jgi:hypothetical protein
MTRHPPPRPDPYLRQLQVELRASNVRSEAEREQFLDMLAHQAMQDGSGMSTFAETKAILRNTEVNPDRLLQGEYISLIRESTLGYLKMHPAYEALADIPVGMLATGLLNGQACHTPAGLPVILLDSGMMYQLTELMHLYYAFHTWAWDNDAHCRDHKQLDFAQSLVMLAPVVLSNDRRLMAHCPGRLVACPSITPSSKKREILTSYATITREFVLLHEYGHVALNHLGKGERRMVQYGAAQLSIEIASHRQEFEADEFAVSAMGRFRDEMITRHNYSVDHIVSLYSKHVGILFRFLDLVEAIVAKSGGTMPGTHPPAAERWRRIRKGFARPDIKKDFITDLDEAFDTILKWYGLAPMVARLG